MSDPTEGCITISKAGARCNTVCPAVSLMAAWSDSSSKVAGRKVQRRQGPGACIPQSLLGCAVAGTTCSTKLPCALKCQQGGSSFCADIVLMRLHLTMVSDSCLDVIRDGLGAHSCHHLHQVLLLQFRGFLQGSCRCRMLPLDGGLRGSRSWLGAISGCAHGSALCSALAAETTCTPRGRAQQRCHSAPPCALHVLPHASMLVK